jgi:hypothetical protein
MYGACLRCTHLVEGFVIDTENPNLNLAVMCVLSRHGCIHHFAKKDPHRAARSVSRIFIRLVGVTVGDPISAEPNSAPTPNKAQYNLFNPTPVDLRRPYNTDRPSKTDSPYTVDAGVFQIESDVANWTLDYQEGVRTRTWIAGNTNFKLGLTNWMDFQVFPQFYVNKRTSGRGFGKPLEQDGFGDTTVRLKINLLGNDGGKLAIGILSSLKIPTNTGDTGNHVWEPGFELPVNYSLPWGFTFFGQTRIDILDQPRSR